jgi:hypothetical protein
MNKVAKFVGGFGTGVLSSHAWNNYWRNKPQYQVISHEYPKWFVVRENWKWDCEGDTPCTKLESDAVFECKEIEHQWVAAVQI